MKWLLLSVGLTANSVQADPAEIVGVEGTEVNGVWRLDVTVLHPDTGWDHYADGWEVVGPRGVQLGYRELAHPHVGEQPFTRSLSGLVIPLGMSEVTIQARCSVDGWTGEPVTFVLPR